MPFPFAFYQFHSYYFHSCESNKIFSLLSGFIPPTRGTAKINSYDIRKDMTNVRRSLGLCPQHNILFDTLTVKEHLIFYSKVTYAWRFFCVFVFTMSSLFSLWKDYIYLKKVHVRPTGFISPWLNSGCNGIFQIL